MMGAIKRTLNKSSVEEELTEKTREIVANQIGSSMLLGQERLMGGTIHQMFRDDLLKARQKTIDGSLADSASDVSDFSESDVLYNRADMTSATLSPDVNTVDTSVRFNDSEGRVRKQLHPTEVRKAFGGRAQEVDDILDTGHEKLRREMYALEDADPVFKGVGRYYGSKAGGSCHRS